MNRQVSPVRFKLSSFYSHCDSNWHITWVGIFSSTNFDCAINKSYEKASLLLSTANKLCFYFNPAIENSWQLLIRSFFHFVGTF